MKSLCKSANCSSNSPVLLRMRFVQTSSARGKIVFTLLSVQQSF
jgi:hypothetical protein